MARRPLLVVALAPLLAGALAHQAIAGAAPPPPAASTTTAALVSDPDDSFGAVRALVRADGHRYQLQARGAQAGQLRRALAGEVVSVAGRVEPAPARRGLAARRPCRRPHRRRAGRPVRTRRPRVAGGQHVPPAARPRCRATRTAAARALFTGFVLGDDRFQDPVTVDDFRATGLSHLLAVSGQNVAFVLVRRAPGPGSGRPAAAVRADGGRGRRCSRSSPASSRRCCGRRRWPPSPPLGTTLGRPLTSLRVLALAVAGLVLIDPLLVRSLGFPLSVAASAGIILLGAGPAARLPGPGPLAELVAVTLAAQGAVAPLLVLLPGGVPLAAVPANLLAVPAAGPLMVWGLTGRARRRRAGWCGGRA